jgi:tight adherence protein B
MPLPNLILLIGGALGLTLLGVGVAVTVFGSRSVVEERLGRYAESGGMVSPAAQEATEKTERVNPLSEYFNRLGEGTNLFDGIARRLARADLKLRSAEYLGVIGASILICTILGTIVGRSVLFGILAGIFGAFLPGMYVGRAEKSRLKKFDGQLGDMLNLIVNGLRAGFSTLQAMEAVSRELPAPICDEFRRVVQEMQLGLSMDDALDHLLRRIKSEDLDLFVTAINVQREVGGNLAEILDVISFTIRERVRIKGEIASLTAQGRATAWVISLLPIALVVLLYLVNRPYIMQFFNPETRSCGIPMLLLAGIMIGSGFYLTQKIVTIDI